MTVAQVAEYLGLSVRTVETYAPMVGRRPRDDDRRT